MTAAAIVCYLNIGVALFAPVPTWYKIVSFIVAGVSWTCSHYYNQDFTEEMCQGTGYGRYLKAQNNPDVYTEPIEAEEEVKDEQDQDR